MLHQRDEIAAVQKKAIAVYSFEFHDGVTKCAARRFGSG